MKELYFVKIQNIKTQQNKSRDMLLTPEQAEGLRKKLGKVENGYKLICFEVSSKGSKMLRT